MDIWNELNEHNLLEAALAVVRRAGIETEIQTWHGYPRLPVGTGLFSQDSVTVFRQDRKVYRSD